jgi:hypothetical protein
MLKRFFISAQRVLAFGKYLHSSKHFGNLKTFLPNNFGQIMKVKKLLLSLPTIPGALS